MSIAIDSKSSSQILMSALLTLLVIKCAQILLDHLSAVVEMATHYWKMKGSVKV